MLGLTSAKLRQYRAAIWGTLGAVGIWLGAIIAVQPDVMPPPLPIASCGVGEWVTTNAYSTVIDGTRIDIPAGFCCDLASIPPQAQGPLGLRPDSPEIRRGALVHDYLYRGHRVPREMADYLLYRACLADGMEPRIAAAVYRAVSLWGFAAYDRQ